MAASTEVSLTPEPRQQDGGTTPRDRLPTPGSAVSASAASAAHEETAVRVALRVRPLVSKERMEGARECIRGEGNKQVVIGKDRAFTFDAVFGPQSEQDNVYNEVVAPLVEGCFSGYNATVLAYGQTGSGKTYTMGSGDISSVLEEQLGIIPRVITDIFTGIEARKNDIEFLVRCSYLEVYNEEVRDLLHPDTPTKNINIRRRANGEIFVAGIQEQVATNYDELARLLERGNVGRTVGSTLMNQHSSRSHAIFTLILEQHLLKPASTSGFAQQQEYMNAKFHLVDLAGSERNKKTGAAGARFKESVAINSGLLALGNVISALGDESKKGGHVPYRESKLTRLLQDSLGGNSRTCMIACVSSADCNMEESLNTLKYANRARNIRNKPVVNRDPESTHLAGLQAEIMELKLELAAAKGTEAAPLDPANLAGTANQRMLEKMLKEMVAPEKEKEISQIREQQEAAEQHIATLGAHLAQERTARAALEEDHLSLKAERDHCRLQVEEWNGVMQGLQTVVAELAAAGHLTPAGQTQLLGVIGSPSSGGKGGALAAAGSPAMSLQTPPRAAPAEETPPRPSTAGARRGEPSEAARGGRAGRGKGEAKAKEERGVLEQHLHTIAALEAQLKRQEGQLRERDEALAAAESNLQRDEVIFNNKIQEIDRLKKQVVKAERERQSLALEADEKVHHLTSKIRALESVAVSKVGDVVGHGRHRSWGAECSEQADTVRQEGTPAPSPAPRARSGSFDPLDDDCVMYGDEDDVMQGGSRPGSPDGSSGEAEGAGREGAEGGEEQREAEALVEAQKVREQERQQHELQQKRIEREVAQLNHQIEQKTQLIRELQHNETEMRRMNTEVMRRMQELEDAVHMKEQEMERMRRDYEAAESDKARNDEEKRHIRHAYEEKLRKMQMQLTSLKRQQAQQESSRLEKERLKGEMRVQALESELQRMRAHQDLLKRKLKENIDSNDDQAKLLAKEKVALIKHSETQSRRIRDLEAENQRQRTIIKRREADLAGAQRRINLAAAGGGGGAPDAGPEARARPKSAANRESPAGEARAAVRPSSSRSPAAPAASSGGTPLKDSAAANVPAPPPDKVKQWMVDDVAVLMKAREAAAQLAKEEAKREQLLAEREKQLNERAKLELQAARAGAAADEEVRGAGARLAALREEAAAAPSAAAAAALQAEAAQLQARLADLQDRRARGALVSPEDEAYMSEIDDRLDALEIEAEYNASAIAEVQKQMKEGQLKEQSIRNMGAKLSSAGALVMYNTFAEKLSEVSSREKQEQRRVCELEEKLQEAQRAGQEMANSFAVREMQFDSRQVQLERDHAQKVASLLAQVDALRGGEGAGRVQAGPGRASQELAIKEQQIHALTKSNLFYKEKYRGLKRQMRAQGIYKHDSEMDVDISQALDDRLVAESSGAPPLHPSDSIIPTHPLGPPVRRQPHPAGQSEHSARGVGDCGESFKASVASSHAAHMRPVKVTKEQLARQQVHLSEVNPRRLEQRSQEVSAELLASHTARHVSETTPNKSMTVRGVPLQSSQRPVSGAGQVGRGVEAASRGSAAAGGVGGGGGDGGDAGAGTGTARAAPAEGPSRLEAAAARRPVHDLHDSLDS